MRVYQFRHIRADGQCSGGFGVNRGLLALAVAALALPLAGSAATRPPVAAARARSSCVALLDGKPLAERPHAADRRSSGEQAEVAARIRAAVPGARIRWRYRLVLNGLAVVAPPTRPPGSPRIPGVRAVQQSVRYHRALYQSPQLIGAPQSGARPSRPRATG